MDTRVLIIDDEERGIIALKHLIEKYCENIQVAGTATNITDAEKLLRDLQPDAIFLDIEMPGGNGFQLLERFADINFDIVFVTAFQEYAIQAIKCAALDYLLKPVKISDLQLAVEKIKKRQAQQTTASDNEKYQFFKTIINDPNPFRKIILSTMDGYFPIKFEEIIYCKADDSYTHFYLSTGKHHLVSKNLKEFEELLTHYHFYRIHKSYLINLNHIERILKTDGITVVMTNSDELPVSFRKKDEFINVIKTMA